MATKESVAAIVESVIQELGAELSKADPITDPDERSPGSEPAAGGLDGGSALAEDPMAGAPGGAPEDMQSLEDIYSQMAPEELEEHAAALQKVMAAQAGAGPETSPAPAPPAGPPMGGPPAGGPPPMMRSEQPIAKSETSKGHFHPEEGPCGICSQRELVKSDRERGVKLQKSVEEQEQRLTQLAKSTIQALRVISGGGRSLRKSVESVSELAYLPRGGAPAKASAAAQVAEMSSAQIAAKLNEKIPQLAKSERDKVAAFYEGRMDLSGIAHLLA